MTGLTKRQQNEASENKRPRRKTVLTVVICASVLILSVICIILFINGNRKKDYSDGPSDATVTAAVDAGNSDSLRDDREHAEKAENQNIPDSSSTDAGMDGSDAKRDVPQSADRHVDEDSNGKCDLCGAKMSVEVDFFAINDLHGKFDDSYGQPGVDELTTYLREMQAISEHTVFLSSGDMWQGSAESNQTEGRVVIEWMNEMGFVSMTLGNHEFDWGEDIISNNTALAEFPFLAINVYDVNTREQVPYCSSSVMVKAGDVKIGIIGAIGDCYSSIAPDQTHGIYFVTGDELTGLVKEEALKLRGEGADFVVYSIHDGYSDSFYTKGADFNDTVKVMSKSRLASYYDTTLSDGYVDLVFEGHTHQNYVLMDTGRVYHLQDGGENDGISHVRAVFTHGGGTIGGYSHECTVTEIVSAGYYSRKESDSLRDDILERYDREIAFTREALGYNQTYMNGDELRRIVAQLYLEAGSLRWGEDYDLVLGGGFLSVRDPRHLDAGDVTYADLQALFPFDNELVLCVCSGYDLKRVFTESVNSNYFTCLSPYGKELVTTGIALNEKYFVVTDTYTSTYAPNNLTEVERYGAPVYARDLLADMYRQQGK